MNLSCHKKIYLKKVLMINFFYYEFKVVTKSKILIFYDKNYTATKKKLPQKTFHDDFFYYGFKSITKS